MKLKILRNGNLAVAKGTCLSGIVESWNADGCIFGNVKLDDSTKV